jgi:hypothetical protein
MSTDRRLHAALYRLRVPDDPAGPDISAVGDSFAAGRAREKNNGAEARVGFQRLLGQSRPSAAPRLCNPNTAHQSFAPDNPLLSV